MLSERSFDAVTAMFHQVSGIRLGPGKRPLVTGRLQKLAQAQGERDLDRYVERLLHEGDAGELARVVDKLTTNETYFFREPEHFRYLADVLAKRPRDGRSFRVWSAASSSGEEAYSIAMLLGERLGLSGWEVIGTDLSNAMVAQAQRALYPMERAEKTPQAYLQRWCRKGVGAYDGQLLISRELRQNVHFLPGNLMQPLPDIGQFDVIFLRNVLIYFDNPSKADIVRRVMGQLAPGGLLFTGHAESIAQLGLPIRALASAVYEAT